MTSGILGPRASGILLHPTSLPGPYGIGDLGPAAYAWLDTLARARQQWWQMLPLGPTGYADSPYQCFSALAGNPYLISPDLLIEDSLLTHTDLGSPDFPHNHVDYGRVIPYKLALLKKAWERFKAGGHALRPAFDEFCAAHAGWLEDFGLFMALKDAHDLASWLTWEAGLRQRKPAALKRAAHRHADRAGQHQFHQFLFFRQWRRLREYACSKGIRLIGDVPIFVSSDSSDVWAHPALFLLDDERQPTVVAGVPPDYFSPTGQLWGNPLYDWPALRQTSYAWWRARMRATLEQVDLIRLDHFRGFEAYWEIQAGMPTAEDGRWVPGPGDALLQALHADLGGLPLIAEDLGVITPGVDALRQGFGLPGMRILQFAFGGAPEDRFLPHNYEPNTVVYTGTHDNDTSRGWYDSISAREQDFCRRYLGRDGGDIAWDLIRAAWASVATLAVTPLQDVLSLGSEARMNVPGTRSGNWTWRFTPDRLTSGVVDRLGEVTELYSR